MILLFFSFLQNNPLVSEEALSDHLQWWTIHKLHFVYGKQILENQSKYYTMMIVALFTQLYGNVLCCYSQNRSSSTVLGPSDALDYNWIIIIWLIVPILSGL